MFNKTRKKEIIDDIKNNLKISKSIIFYDLHNIDNNRIFDIKKQLFFFNSKLRFYKNTLIKIAFKDLYNLKLNGSNAIIFCGDEYKTLSILNNFDKKKSRLKFAIYENDLLEGKFLKDFSDRFSSKEDLLKFLCFFLNNQIRLFRDLLLKITETK